MNDNFSKIRNTISKSGNNLHIDILKVLRNKQWEVTVSPFYLDNSSEKGKEREIDVVATKKFRFKRNSIVNHEDLEFEIKLFIEAKYFSNDVIFWKDQIQDGRVKEATKYALNINYIPNLLDYALPIMHYKKFHEDNKISKLVTYAKDPEGKNNNEDAVFQSFHQCIKALNYFRILHPTKCVYMPVVVYKSKGESNVYTYDMEKEENDQIHQVDQQELEVIYSLKNSSTEEAKIEVFLVDYVNFNMFEEFLKMIEDEDARKIKEILSEHVK